MGKFTLVTVLGIGSIVMIIWFLFAIPELVNSTDILEVSAQNTGMIQIADEVGAPLSDPIKMVFDWDSSVVERHGNDLLIHTKYIYKDILN